MLSKKKRRIVWNTESEKLLIQLWKKYPKVQHNIRDRPVLEKMALEFRKRGINMGPSEIGCKIHNFRNKYRKEKATNCPLSVISSDWQLFNAVQHIIDGNQDMSTENMVLDNVIKPQSELSIESVKSCSSPPDGQAKEAYLISRDPIWSDDSESESLKSGSWWFSVKDELPQPKTRKRFCWKGNSEKLMLKLWSWNPKVTNSLRDRPILKKMSLEFQKHGIEVSPVEIGFKIHNLKVTYRREKAKMRQIKDYHTEWRLFDAVHEIYGAFDVTDTQEIRNNIDFESSELTVLPGPRSPIGHDTIKLCRQNFTKKSLPEEESDNESVAESIPSETQDECRSMKRKTRRFFWNEKSENFLIQLWSKSTNVSSTITDKPLLEKISLIFQKEGINVSPAEIGSKIHNFKIKYRWEKHKMSQLDGYHSEWKLFDTVHQIIGDFESSNNGITSKNLVDENNFETSEFFTLLPGYNYTETKQQTLVPEDGSVKDTSKAGAELPTPKVNNKNLFIWNEKNENFLIKLWSKNPKVTYTPKNMHTLRKMSLEFHKYGVDISPDEIEDKLYQLRDKYQKEKDEKCPLDAASDWRFYDAVHQILDRSLNTTTENMILENDLESTDFLKLFPRTNSPTESIRSCSLPPKLERNKYNMPQRESQQSEMCRQIEQIHHELREWRKESKEIEEKKTTLMEKHVNTMCELKDAFILYLNRVNSNQLQKFQSI